MGKNVDMTQQDNCEECSRIYCRQTQEQVAFKRCKDEAKEANADRQTETDGEKYAHRTPQVLFDKVISRGVIWPSTTVDYDEAAQFILSRKLVN